MNAEQNPYRSPRSPSQLCRPENRRTTLWAWLVGTIVPVAVFLLLPAMPELGAMARWILAIVALVAALRILFVVNGYVKLLAIPFVILCAFVIWTITKHQLQ